MGKLETSEGNVPSETLCLQLCKESKRCRWITYHNEESFCLLFEDCQTLDDSEPDKYVSSERRCELELESTTSTSSTTQETTTTTKISSTTTLPIKSKRSHTNLN